MGIIDSNKLGVFLCRQFTTKPGHKFGVASQFSVNPSLLNNDVIWFFYFVMFYETKG